MADRILTQVRVQFLQEDMIGFEETLPYAVQDLMGKCFFSENVLWGEIWIVDQRRDLRWSGYVKDGELYLEQSQRPGSELLERERKLERPALLPVGEYKIWLDAWIRQGHSVYKGDPRFTKHDADEDWIAPPIPSKKHWQDISITPPRGAPKESQSADRTKPQRIAIRSRRFHWLYRLSRLIDTLDHLLESHHAITREVALFRDKIVYLHDLLYVMLESGNQNRILAQERETFLAMTTALREVLYNAQLLLRYGWKNERALRERAHLNNLAWLVFKMTSTPDFQDAISETGGISKTGQIADEHSCLLGRIPLVLNRIPQLCSSVTRAAGDIDPPTAREVSPRWGQRFAEEFTFPFYNMKLGKRAFVGKATPKDRLNWLNSTRRYGISMLNAGSVFVNVSRTIAWADLKLLLEAQFELQKIRDATAVSLELATLRDKARAAGKVARAGGMRIGKIKETTEELRAAVIDLDKQLERVGERVASTTEEQAEKVTDSLKRGGRTAVGALYCLQLFECWVKWAVAVSAWEALADEAEAGKGGVELAKTFGEGLIKTTDALGTGIQLGANVMERLVKVSMVERWVIAEGARKGVEAADYLAIVAKRAKMWGNLGRGLGVVADVGSAAIYSADFLRDSKYRKELASQFLPEDADGAAGFHMLVATGKWMVAAGSASKNPKLVFFGYLAQLVGEFSEEYVLYGKAVKALFHRTHQEVIGDHDRLVTKLKGLGFGDVILYRAKPQEGMARWMREFKWHPLDEQLYKSRFSTNGDKRTAIGEPGKEPSRGQEGAAAGLGLAENEPPA